MKVNPRPGTPMPCPICGSDPLIWEEGQGWIILCRKTGTTHHEVFVKSRTRKSAMWRWGTRWNAWKVSR